MKVRKTDVRNSDSFKKGVMMNNRNHNSGIQLLLDRYRTAFRIPENLEHYSDEDYKRAERCFLKYAIKKGPIENREVPGNK